MKLSWVVYVVHSATRCGNHPVSHHTPPPTTQQATVQMLIIGALWVHMFVGCLVE